MEKWIYLDHAATTKMRSEVIEEMLPYFDTYYGNAGSSYGLGAESRKAIKEARLKIARTLNVLPDEIYFTSGGTESDNWALRGVAEAYRDKGKHIIVSKVEHSAILQTCKYLEAEGYQISYINVDKDGVIDLQELERAIRPDTILISVMYANNEVGTIQPIKEISQIAHQKGVLFHTDAVHAYAHIPISAKEDGFDLLSASAHKFNGPKGVGFLYIKGYKKLRNLMCGGGQENGKRAGTENVAGIVGMAKAAELAEREMPMRMEWERHLREELWEQLQKEIPAVVKNGSSDKRVPGNLHVSFLGYGSENLIGYLDRKGIYVSGGSACLSRDGLPSNVMMAMGKSLAEIKGSVRFSISYENTREEILEVVQKLKEYYQVQDETDGKRGNTDEFIAS